MQLFAMLSKISVLETRSSDLSDLSKKYREDARQLNRRNMMTKLIIGLGLAGVLFFVLRFFVF